eukprot:jgi/Botrbrau1/4326/Bobra.0232s0017.2
MARTQTATSAIATLLILHAIFDGQTCRGYKKDPAVIVNLDDQSYLRRENVTLALVKSWRSLEGISLDGQRVQGVQELASQQQLDQVFGKQKVYGPVFRWSVKVYGRDISYPAPSRVLETVAKVLTALQEDYGGARVTKAAYYFPPCASLAKHNYEVWRTTSSFNTGHMD